MEYPQRGALRCLIPIVVASCTRLSDNNHTQQLAPIHAEHGRRQNSTVLLDLLVTLIMGESAIHRFHTGFLYPFHP